MLLMLCCDGTATGLLSGIIMEPPIHGNGAEWCAMSWSGVSQTGLVCCGLGWRVVERIGMVWRGAYWSGLV